MSPCSFFMSPFSLFPPRSVSSEDNTVFYSLRKTWLCRPFHGVFIFYFINTWTCLRVQLRVDTQTGCAPTPGSEDEPFEQTRLRPRLSLDGGFPGSPAHKLARGHCSFKLRWVHLRLWGSSVGTTDSPAWATHWPTTKPSSLLARAEQ